jgi:hypothetical protein
LALKLAKSFNEIKKKGLQQFDKGIIKHKTDAEFESVEKK